MLAISEKRLQRIIDQQIHLHGDMFESLENVQCKLESLYQWKGTHPPFESFSEYMLDLKEAVIGGIHGGQRLLFLKMFFMTLWIANLRKNDETIHATIKRCSSDPSLSAKMTMLLPLCVMSYSILLEMGIQPTIIDHLIERNRNTCWFKNFWFFYLEENSDELELLVSRMIDEKTISMYISD